jgi:hypothetical protein
MGTGLSHFPYPSPARVASGNRRTALWTAIRRNGFYPKSPQPKDAVHRMEKATRTIIQISSFFMVNTSFGVAAIRPL